jgi:hypothetical protein
VHAAGEKRVRKPEGKVIVDGFDLCVVKGTLGGLGTWVGLGTSVGLKRGSFDWDRIPASRRENKYLLA